MSSTPSSPAAELLAAALIQEAGAAADDQRLFLTEYLEVAPHEVHAALMDRADLRVDIPEGGEPIVLSAIDCGGAVLIPYNVVPANQWSTNQGSQGFAARLRSQFLLGNRDDGKPRVLLVLDPDPVETVSTTAEDAAGLEALSWPALCRAAASGPVEERAPALAKGVLEDFSKLLVAPGRKALDELRRFSTADLPAATDYGDRLHVLGLYVRDPDAGTDAARLSRGRRWRSRIEGWTEPGKDLAGQLRKTLGADAPVVKTILGAKGPRGIDYGRFTLSDLEARNNQPPDARFHRPIRVAGAKAALVQAASICAWWDQPGGSLRLGVSRDLDGTERVELRWADRAARSGAIDEALATAVLPVDAAREPEWRFGRAVLLRDGDVLDAVAVAAYIGDGTWFPVERSRLLDVHALAFRVEAEPDALAIAPGGGVLGPVPLEGATGEPGERVSAVASREGQRHELPLLLLGEDVSEDPEPPEDPSDAPPDPEPSPVHALLRAVSENREPPDSRVTFNAADGAAFVTVGSTLFELLPQRAGRFSALDLEAQVLARPDVWAFTAAGSEEELRLLPDSSLERLSLKSLPGEALRAFREARSALFAELRDAGASVYALASGPSATAEAYVAAYAGLLASLPRHGHYQAEFNRLLLVDLVSDPETGDRLLAPTNPVSVAFYCAFRDAGRVWAAEEQLLHADDVRTISPRHLLPAFNLGGTWYEDAPVASFLWRRFIPTPEVGSDTDDDASFVRNRLEFFLRVHPAYADPRQRMRITMLEPGTGEAAVSALERFFVDELESEAGYTRPQLEIHFVSRDGSVPPAVTGLMAGGEGERPIERLIRSRVTVSASRERPRFSHITFVFRTPSGNVPGPVDMGDRASSLYVGGLAAAPGRAIFERANERAFAWGTFAAKPAGRPPGGRTTDLLPEIVRRTAELVGGQPRELLQDGVTRMLTTAVEPGFMPEVYDASVWVVHLDRLIGLEAFAPDPEKPERYLIDYEERADPMSPGLDGITATQRVDPYREALAQALAELGPLAHAGIGEILRRLNSVSGQWALQLLRRPPERIRERIGTVAAIAMVEEVDRGFERPNATGILLPLDELFRNLPEGRPPGRDTSACDDLLHVVADHGAGSPVTVHARVLEVKYRSTGRPDLGHARQEIENTHAHIERVFNTQSPARLFRARDLADVLRAAVGRGRAFGLLAAAARPELEVALDHIASGNYVLNVGYWIDGQELIGDVVSIELESSVDIVRAPLPGAGPAAGLVRLGRPALEALANARPLRAPSGWRRPQFDEPHAESRVGDGTDSGSGLARGENAASSSQPEVEEEVRQLATALDGAVLKYGLDLEPFQPALALAGPSVIRLRARPLGTQSLSGVSRFAEDITREIGATDEVLVAQEPYYITIDVPRRERQIVEFSEYVHLLDGDAEPGALNFLVGVAPSGHVAIEDIARLPHLLIAGATGSGKSVFLRCVLCSLLRRRSPEELSILLVDPKQVDFLPFEDLPHLQGGRIVFHPAEAVGVLSETIGRELDRRRPILKNAGVTSAVEFYEAGGALTDLPQMVVVVDEFADLAGTLGRGERAEFMALIQRYGQLTRAFGIYLVLATQRPSVQVITGDIKANLTARVALKVQSPEDSRTILGHGGAQSLRDRGDLLFEHAGRSERLQGFMVRPRDVADAVARWT